MFLRTKILVSGGSDVVMRVNTPMENPPASTRNSLCEIEATLDVVRVVNSIRIDYDAIKIGLGYNELGVALGLCKSVGDQERATKKGEAGNTADQPVPGS